MRYTIGIDLGTTNCSISYIDHESKSKSPRPFLIHQTIREGYTQPLPELPSFCYIAEPGEFTDGTLDLPWEKKSDYTIGTFALAQGSRVPTGLVRSAKSVLSGFPGSQRDAILPFDARNEKSRISPVEASKRYLHHIRMAWNHQIAKNDPNSEFERQEIIITIPASFGEPARVLTAEAAKLAGYEKITFLEEPQAAFYWWISQNEKDWSSRFQSGDIILVCDVGGGTTDFSLIEFTGKGDTAGFERMAVGDHLLLGGDNMDAALAEYVENKIGSDFEPDSTMRKQLYYEARKGKEELLSGKSEVYKITIQGKGSGVVKGSVSVELHRSEVIRFFTEGFFSVLPWEEAQKIRRKSGFRSLGLAYEEEPSISKQLAHFLSKSGSKKPNFLLFNGGVMAAKEFRDAIKQNMEGWFSDNTIELLENKNVSDAVSRGAAYYGRIKRGSGIKIRAGSPRNFYLQIEEKVLCVMARGADEGSLYEPLRKFSAKPNKPVSFTLYTSHVRIGDKPGDVIALNEEEFYRLPPIFTVLRYGKQPNETDAGISVALEVLYTTLGTLQLSLLSSATDHRWNLEFQLKTAEGIEDHISYSEKGRTDETFDDAALTEAKSIIDEFFTGNSSVKPSEIMGKIEESLDLQREEWSPGILRSLAGKVLAHAHSKNISETHEAKWWNLIGYFLRPGFGFPLDDHKIGEVWKIILQDLKSPKSEECALQQLICLRRIAGGLNKGRQTEIYHHITSSFGSKKIQLCIPKSAGEKYRHQEKIRTLSSLERIEQSHKVTLGRAILAEVKKGKGTTADFWALGRLGSRSLFYGSPAHMISGKECAEWVMELYGLHNIYPIDRLSFPLTMLAKKTAQKDFNVSQEIRDKIKIVFTGDSDRIEMIEGNVVQSDGENDIFFGEKLPAGLCFGNDL